jgi:TolB-like protein
VKSTVLRNAVLTALLTGAAIVATVATVLAADRTYRVAIVPFQIHSEKDLTFMRDGIADMLASRLSWEDKVTVLGRDDVMGAVSRSSGAINEMQAQMIGASLEVDYVLFGSLTVFGDSVSVDARLVDVSGQQATLSFFEQAQGMGQVIPRINQFASDINEKVFGRQVRRPVPAAPAQPRAVGARDIHAHPEKLIQGGAAGSEYSSLQSSELNPAFQMARGRQGSGPDFWKSRDLKHRIVGMAAGDVDGDGQTELVLISPKAVYLTRVSNSRFAPLQEIDRSRNRNNVGVDVADINGNGRAEIFVSSLGAQQNGVHSFVLENAGNAYRTVVDGSRWLFRVTRLADRGTILLGQSLKAGRPYVGTTHELVAQGSDYIAGREIVSSRYVNLMGAAYGDIMNNGSATLVAFSPTDRIQILDNGGKRRWTASEKYGGTNLFFIKEREEAGTDNKVFLPMRLRIIDLDGDGKYELLSARNREATGRMLKDFRMFTGGQMELLAWDGIGISPVWSTRKIAGQISDFAVADYDNDGQDELVATVIIKGGYIVGTSPRSAVIAYELNVESQ